MVMPPCAERPLRVGLAGDDAPVIELGIARMLRPYSARITFVGRWSADAARGLLSPDVVLFDPTLNTPRYTEVLHGRPWVGFSWSPSHSTVTAALARGALGFVDKAADGRELAGALHRIHLGQLVVPVDCDPTRATTSGMTKRAARSDEPPGRGRHPGSLSDREAMMIALIADGLSNNEIATKCFLSINTVKTYIKTAYRKIGVEKRTHAVVWAVENGYATWRT